MHILIYICSRLHAIFLYRAPLCYSCARYTTHTVPFNRIIIEISEFIFFLNFFPNFCRRNSCMSAKMDSERSIYGAIAGTFGRPQTASASTATVLLLFAFVAVASLQIATWTPFPRWTSVTGNRPPEVSESAAAPDDPRSCGGFFEGGAARRKAVKSIREFGGVGDGKTSETEAFRRAVRHLRRFGESGGSQLNVPRGRWLTGSFNLTSNFTLFLEDGAVLLGSQVRPKQNKLLFFIFLFNF